MTMKKKMLPVGIENFEEIISLGFYYIDKTGLIKELLNNWSKVNLFTRPRRFGKSLNMSMLRYFFEIGANANLFDGLEIAKETELCDEYMGKFPVVSVSLKGISGSQFENAKDSLKNVIRMEALRHQYLMDSDKLSKYDKAEFEHLLIGSMSDNMVEQSLWLLSKSLFAHYGKKVVILIDEYDVPLAKAFDYGYYSDMVHLIRGIFERTLKTNEFLQMSVLSGCLRVAKESIFTGMNNPKIHSITDVQFDEYFGFTDKEVLELLTYYGFEKKYRTAKKWYDGYKFGDVSVYCPWDVINYVYDLRANEKIKPKNYWSNTSSNDIIRRFLDKADETTKWEIERLIAGERIEKEVYQELTYAELDKTINHLWSVLFTTGYLTYQEKADSTSDDDSDFKPGTLLLTIPNEEIRSIYKTHILSWFDDLVETDADRYRKFSEAFVDGDTATIEEMFNQYLIETISIRDTSIKKSMKENFYHGILLGILKFRRDWIVKSNQESGDGYNDIMVMFNAKRLGLVIEVKYADNGDLDSECAKAMAQIEKLNYTASLKEHEPEKVLKYGIACYKKRCKVTMAEEIICK